MLGAAATGATITVDVSLRPRDPSGLAAFARDVSTPGNPRYHHYVPAGQLAGTFGPTPATLASTRAWLASAGLTVGRTSADGLEVPVTGSTGQVESAFGVHLEQARLQDGRQVRLSTTDPSVPASLAPQLQGVLGLSTDAVESPHVAGVAPVVRSAAHVAPRAVADALGPQPCAAISNGANGWTATQLAATYGLHSLYAAGRTGAGQTVGLFELENYVRSDVDAYQSCYGTNVPVTNVNIDGGTSDAPTPNEATLDIEVVAGLAPGAAVKVFTGPNTNTGVVDTYAAMVADPSVRVISSSSTVSSCRSSPSMICPRRA